MRYLVLLSTILSLVYGPYLHGAVVGRLQLNHPALGTVGGSALHSSIESLWTIVSDDINSRYTEFSGVTNATTYEVNHNFGTFLSEIKVDLYSGVTGSLTRITEASSPALSLYTIQQKTGEERTTIEIITPASGTPSDLAVILSGHDIAESLDDLDDVDISTTAPEDGQALVYSASGSEWLPGASGDSSFKIQAVTDPNGTIKGGTIGDDLGRQYATYDGVGGDSTDFRGDLVCDLDTILGSNPANATAYMLFIDTNSVGNTPTTTGDTSEELYPVECTDFALLTSWPEDTLTQRYIHIGRITSATSGTVWSGAGASFGTFAIRTHSRPVVNTSPVVYSLAQQQINSVGANSQIKGGHTLAASSVSSTTGKGAWPFEGNATAAFGPALTSAGSPVFTETDIFGAGTAFDSTAGRYFTEDTIATATSFTYGAFLKTDWSTLAGGNSIPFSVTDGASTTRNSRIVITTGSQVQFQIETSGGGFNIIYDHSFADDDYVHLAFVHDETNDLGKIYVNGLLVLSEAVTGTLDNLTTERFTIGALGDGTSTFDGAINQAFFANSVLTGEEIRKLASYRIDHNKNIAIADQNWIATFNGNLANQLDSGWIVDKSADSIWFDFFDLATSDNVGIKLKNENATSHILPVNTFDTGFLSAAPSFPLSHGLGSVPTQVEVIHEGQTTAGDFDDVRDKCSWDDTSIDCTGLNTIDGTHRLRIVMSTSTVAVAVAPASGTESGIVTTLSQTFGGDKAFTGNVTVGDDDPDGVLSVGDNATNANTVFNLRSNTNGFVGMRIHNGTTGGRVFVGTDSDLQMGHDSAANGAGTFTPRLSFSNNATDGKVQLSVHEDGTCDTVVTDGNVCSGTYTPTEQSNNGNCSSQSIVLNRYMRVGSVVTVSGKFDINQTSTGACTINFNLPIAATTNDRVAGTCAAQPAAAAYEACYVNWGSNQAHFRINTYTATISVKNFFYHFTYNID